MSVEGERRRLRFLLVEDDDDHAKIVCRSLQREGIPNHVDRVRDGLAALELLRRLARDSGDVCPDVVLLDLKLPGKDGHEVLGEIKSDPALRSIPVVVLTTSDADSDRVMAYERHANSYLVKPLDADQFRSMLHDLCSYWGAWNRPPLRRGH